MKDSEENAEQSAGPRRGLSRRGFLRGAGITAAGGVLITSGLTGLADAEAAPAPDTVGPGRTSITLKINGDKKKVAVEPRQTLAEVLRTELNLTGTKVVCDRGACSACTVWLDNLPINSCMTLAIEVGKREITTIEGLAKNGKLHPVQEAFVAHDASMCGFCTPGMVMSCASLLQRNPRPTLDDVKTATSGNLCRCGTYPKVFEATLAAAGIAYSQTQAQAAKG